MVAVLAVVIPLALAGALSPMMLTEQTVLLAGPDGRRSAARYAVGAALTLLAFAGAVVLFGRSISLPQEPHLDATLDLVLGAVLVMLSLLLHRRRARQPKPRPRRGPLGPFAALGFGAVSMATNVTTLALIVPAAKEVAASDLGPVRRAVVVGVIVALASIPAWSPVALAASAPQPAARILGALANLIESRGRLLVVIALAVLGSLLMLRGVVRLLRL